MTGGYRPGDEQFDTRIRAVPWRRRRSRGPRGHAERNRPTRVRGRGLVTGDSIADDIPHVIGVRGVGGEEIRADYVVDCGGRRSALPRMLVDIGAATPREQIEDCGFVYYGRHFRGADGAIPPAFGPLLMPYTTYSTLTLPADNGTWAVGVITSSRDTQLRRLKDPDVWDRVIKSTPLVRGLERRRADLGRHRGHGRDRRPSSHVRARRPAGRDRSAARGRRMGVYQSSLGRGISIGTLHARRAARPLARPAGRPRRHRSGMARPTTATVEPWYRSTLSFDSSRLAEIDAQIAGDPFEPGPEYGLTLAHQCAAGKDPELLRALVEDRQRARTARDRVRGARHRRARHGARERMA